MNVRSNEKLHKEIQYFVEKKIKDVKFPDEILINNIFQLSDAVNIYDIKKSYHQDNNLLQPSINLFNDYERYKDVAELFTKEELNLMLPGNFYSYVASTDSWVWSCRPDNRFLIAAIVDYIICFKSLQMEDNISLKSDDRLHSIIHCPFCDEIVKYGEVRCGICSASIEDVRFFADKNASRQSVISEIGFEYRTETIENHEETKKLEEHDNDTDVKTFVMEIEEIAKQSQGMNESEAYNTMTNDKNDYNEVESGLNNVSNHDSENLLLASATGDKQDNGSHKVNELEHEFQSNLWKDKWKCFTCELLNSYKLLVCDACFSPMELCGNWMCKDCTFWNRFLNSNCTVCGLPNKNMVIKFCQCCKRRKIDLRKKFCEDCVNDHKLTHRMGYWRCPNLTCYCWNEDNKKYCVECGIWRQTLLSSIKYGESVKILKNRVEMNVWVCSQCFSFNNENKTVCGWLCRTRRYKKRPSRTCGRYGDGQSNMCGQCQEPL